MKIAYLLLAYIEPEMCERLIERITKDGDYVFLHVDKKVEDTFFRKIAQKYSNCVFCEDRVEITWGGFNMIQAFLNLASLAMETCYFDRFYFLSGQEYPLQSNSSIHKFFELNSGVEFINAYDAFDKGRRHNWIKYYYYWDYDDMNFFKKIRRFFFKIMYKLGPVKIPFKPKTINNNGDTLKIYDGWTTICLTNGCMKYVLDFDKRNIKVKKYFKTVFAPDESYIHTIIFNSNFAKHTVFKRVLQHYEDAMNLTYFDYSTLVKVFSDPSECSFLMSTNKLFFRKVTSGSVALCNVIDKEIENAEKNIM